MKKIVMAAVLTAMSMTAMADDYSFLTVAYNDIEQSFELATVQKITFDTQNAKVVLTTSNGEVSFPQSEMQKMFFSATATAIEKMPVESDGLKVQGGVLEANGNGFLRIYNASGALQRMAKVDGQMRVSLEGLPKGVYVVNMGSQTIKLKK